MQHLNSMQINKLNYIQICLNKNTLYIYLFKGYSHSTQFGVLN